MNKFSASISKMKYRLKKNAPIILTCTSIICSAAAIIMCGIETSKFKEKVKDPLKEKLNEIEAKINDKKRIAGSDEVIDLSNEYAEKTRAYLKAGMNFLKLYSPTLILFAVSTTSMIGSTKILAARNMALATAYGALKESYDAYRNRVRLNLSEDKDVELHEGNEQEKVEDPKSDKIPANNDFTVLYCEGCDGWEKNTQMNLDYLLAKQAYLNQKLRIAGFMFMSEVYKELGIDQETIPNRLKQASHVVGWIYDPKDTDRDSYISFGLTDKDGFLTKKAKDMLDRNSRNVYIELNPDGDILTGNNKKRTFVETIKKGSY